MYIDIHVHTTRIGGEGLHRPSGTRSSIILVTPSLSASTLLAQFPPGKMTLPGATVFTRIPSLPSLSDIAMAYIVSALLLAL